MGADLRGLPYQEPSGYALLVMDDSFLRKLIRDALEEWGVPVREGLSVARALAHAAVSTPAVVFLDLWVDHGSGLRLLEALRLRPEGKEIPVWLLGQEPRVEVREQALAFGAHGPIPLQEIHRLPICAFEAGPVTG